MALRAQTRIGWDNFLIGRWSVEWSRLQQAYYSQAGSRKSALQWLICTLHLLIQGQWHLWDYRNQRFRGKGGLAAVTEHRLLNDRIDREFIRGWDGLTMVEAQIFSRGQTADSVKAMPLSDKRDWLNSVDAGRKGLRPVRAPADDNARMRALMRETFRPRA